MSSLPVPLSPRISTVVLLLATFYDRRAPSSRSPLDSDDAVEVVDVVLRVAEVFDLVLHSPSSSAFSIFTSISSPSNGFWM